jgi:ABC-type Na+ efflux pump permease subunit
MLYGTGGILWFSLGIAAVVVGIFFLIAGSFVVILFGPSSPGCATDPLCAASPALHILFVAVGVLFLVLGIYGFVHGSRRSMTRSTWLSLPP